MNKPITKTAYEDRKPIDGELRVEASGCPIRIMPETEQTLNYVNKLSHSTRVFVEQFDGTRDAVDCGRWDNVQAGRPVCPWCHADLTDTGCSNGLCEAAN